MVRSDRILEDREYCYPEMLAGVVVIAVETQGLISLPLFWLAVGVSLAIAWTLLHRLDDSKQVMQ